MLRLIQLYLPVLFPSWRFFEEIGASPRVEFRVAGGPWIEATQRPLEITWHLNVARLFWNGAWNESLFLVTLAERLLMGASDKAEAELARRLLQQANGATPLIFRIRLVDADGDEIAFVSDAYEF